MYMEENSTMRDYLKWRGDLTFEQDPFNDVDNLILAQLAYVDYDGIVSEDREDRISIGEVCKLYWERHTEEEIRKRESFVKLSPFLLKPVAQSRRFASILLKTTSWIVSFSCLRICSLALVLQRVLSC